MYDLVVIGSGPGGYVAAIKAAQLGMNVAVIEKAEVGGTCLNRGCIPTKTLLHASEGLEEVAALKKSGIHVSEATVDFKQLYQRKNEVVEKLVGGIENLLKANGVTTISGQAKIIEAHKIQVDEQLVEAKNILVATGSVPAIPPIKGSDLPNVISSNELLAEVPDFQHLVIIGGGVIGVEFASIFHALGCQVTIVEASDRLLPNFDKEISKKLALSLKKKGITIYTKASVSEIQQQENSLACLFESKNKETEVLCDKVLIATGRKANFEGLFAEDVTFEVENRAIKVNEQFQTNISNIYAIGDVASRGVQLAHVASAQGVNAVLHMNGKEMDYDLSIVPSCVYTSPEIASVGIDEQTAKEQQIPVKVGKYNMAGNSKSMIADSDLGFIKVISHEESGKVLGAQLMCERATDMIMHFSQMIHQEVTVHEALKTMYPHPTFSEGIGEALENTYGKAIHVMPARK